MANSATSMDYTLSHQIKSGPESVLEMLAEAVCPAEFTVTVGIYVPGGVAVLAVKVIWPEGLVSLAAYVHCIPVGRLPTFTSAVSLVELMRICTTTGIPSCDTVIFDMGNETEIGGA